MTIFERIGSRIHERGTFVKTSARTAASFGTNFDLLRLGALLFLLPNMFFMAGLTLVPAISVFLGCLLASAVFWKAGRNPNSFLAKPIEYKAFVGCFALSLTSCVLGGEAHFFYATYDWLTRDAVLADLVHHETINLYAFQGRDYILRAPLGLYLVPAMVGRAFGLVAAHYALLVQNATLLAIILYIVVQLMPRHKAAAAIVFILFSGVDILPALIANAAQNWRTGRFAFDRQLDWWNGEIQYPSHVTQLFWAPNHTLPAWWFAALLLLHVRREISLAMLAASFAPLVLWSPLAMVGALPFLLVFGLAQSPLKIMTPSFLAAVVSGAGFLPIALYTTIDGGRIPHEFMLWREGFLLLWPIFLMVEIPHAAVVALQWRLVEACDRRILLVAVAALIFIPIYSFGENDDFAMRVSSTPMFVLAFVFARIAVLTPRDGGGMASAISSIVIISATTPIVEIKTAFLPAGPISDCNLMTAWMESEAPFPTHYLAPRERAPTWLKTSTGPALEVEQRTCRLDHPARLQQ
jgi:hypothetical protein